MYPVLFRLGTFEVTSFGVLVALGALVGLWILGRELRRSGIPEPAADAGLVGVLGGLAGAKLLWVAENLGHEPFFSLLFSRGGLSWFGGFTGGVLAGLWLLWRRGLPILGTLAAATPALAVGHAIGRIGCFLVGDDYGRETSGWWAVAFPKGLPPTDPGVTVHPTQLYEAALLLPVAALLIHWRRAGRSDGFVFGAYLALAGALRFGIEFIRVNTAVLGPFTTAQLFAAAAVIAGVVIIIRSGGAAQAATGRA